MDETHLYVYENSTLRQCYIGIGTSLERFHGDHSENAKQLLQDPNTKVWHALNPFSTREDALQAEAIAIRIAALGRLIDEDGVSWNSPQNRAGVQSSRFVVTLQENKEGSIHYDNLARTAIVTVGLDKIDPVRGTIGAHKQNGDRILQYWRLSTAAREGRPVERLLAVSKGTHRIVGDWDLDSQRPFENTEPSRANAATWRFNAVDPAEDDPRGIKGMKYEWSARVGQPQVGPIYSADLR